MIETMKVEAFDGLELIRSRDIQQDAPRHFHEGYAIGIALRGLQTIVLQDQAYIISPGSIMLLNPREVHAHVAFKHIAWSHLMLYISPSYIAWLQQQGRIRKSGKLRFDVSLTVDNNIFQIFLNTHYSCSRQPHSSTTRSLFDRCMSRVFTEFSSRSEEANYLPAQELMMEVQNLIERQHQQRLNLEGLAKKVCLTKYQLIRSFKRYKGVTPNEFLNIIRVEKAKNFILQGNSLIDSAIEAGFYDQSHFTHYFTQYTSFTPGQFQRSCGKIFSV